MTRADLTEEVYPAVGMPLKESDAFVSAIFDSLARALRSGDKVEIRADSEASTRAKEGHASDARVDVPPKRVAFFKPSKELRDCSGGSCGLSNKGDSHEPHCRADPDYLHDR